MGFAHFVGAICSIFLYIYNFLMMIAGIIITIKGIYALMNANEAHKYIMGRLLGVDEVYRELGMSYILPGCLMIFIGVVGWKAAGRKVTALVIYVAVTVLLMCGSAYGVSSPGSNKFSLYSYLNRIFISEDLGLLQGVAYPEYGMQVALVASSIYLLFLCYLDKRRKEKDLRAAQEYAVLQNIMSCAAAQPYPAQRLN